MRFNSVRVKSSLPVVVMALTFVVTLLALGFIINQLKASLNEHTNHYEKAISVVLNADRDAYQAKLAEQRIVADLGDVKSEEVDRTDNIQQVKDRFNLYKEHMSIAPQVVNSLGDFDKAFDAWVKASEAMVQTDTNAANYLSVEKQANDTFSTMRDILDAAGVAVYEHAIESKKVLEAQLASSMRVATIVVIIGVLIAVWFSYKTLRQKRSFSSLPSSPNFAFNLEFAYKRSMFFYDRTMRLY